MAQRVPPLRVPAEAAPVVDAALADPRFDPLVAGFGLASLRIEPTARPNRRRRRENSRTNLWGVDLRGAADILLALAVVLLLLAAIAAAVGLFYFAR